MAGRSPKSRTASPPASVRDSETFPFMTDAAAPLEIKRTPAKKTKPESKPHYHGHRERLRERFDQAGADALADYELL
ncbi:MAG TPA: hypothetical protein PLN53_14300, partial [Terricaulis sp.]|nr:hypothetical protein [Terricaulis sp.]